MIRIIKERTPEQIEAAKARMAAARAAKASKPKASAKEIMDSGVVDVPKAWLKKGHRSSDPALLEKEDLRSKSLPDEFAGISAKDCCESCYASKGERCAITHRPLCGHPLKGGLQQPDQMRPDTVERFARAKKILAHAKIEAA